MTITKGKQPSAVKLVVYGPEGIGKSTFLAGMPKPLFLDTEGSTKFMEVDRAVITGWDELLGAVRQLTQDNGGYRSVAIDTADWAEKLCTRYVIAQANNSRNKGAAMIGGIEDFGYGKGYTYLAEAFKELLDALEALVQSGVNVGIAAHAALKKFEQPDELGAYDRWELKLEKKTSPLLKEWADILLFANYETFVSKSKEGKAKASGGRRVMFTEHNPCWDAKNRFGLDEKYDFDFTFVSGIFPAEPKKAEKPAPKAKPKPAEEQKQEPAQAPEPVTDKSLIPKLREAMLSKEHPIFDTELQEFVAAKHPNYAGLKIDEYPDKLVEWLLRNWQKIVKMIEANPNRIAIGDDDALPF